jgi:hypothetical protein
MRPAHARAILTAAALMPVGPASAQVLPEHDAFTKVLSPYVRDGLVDYAGLQENRVPLDAYLGQLAEVDPADLERAQRADRLAFWINAYNACALRLVIDHYPIEKAGFPASLVKSLQGVPGNSIRQIPNTWDGEFCEVAGTARSLDGIEHGIIRPMGDPRIHFAVNCASRSCPELVVEAYTRDRLDGQLDAAVRRLIADERHFRLDDGDRPTLRLNKVLDWYKDDFGGIDGVVEFLVPYVRADLAAALASGTAQVEFFEYDWTLNDTAVFGMAR